MNDSAEAKRRRNRTSAGIRSLTNAGNGGIWSAKFSRIKSIQSFDTGLELDSLESLEILEHRDIRGRFSGTALVDGAGRVAERQGGNLRKGSRIDPSVNGTDLRQGRNARCVRTLDSGPVVPIQVVLSNGQRKAALEFPYQSGMARFTHDVYGGGQAVH